MNSYDLPSSDAEAYSQTSNRVADQHLSDAIQCAMNRREFVLGAGMVAGAAAVKVPVQAHGSSSVADVSAAASSSTMPLSLAINGQQHSVAIDPRVTLLDLLREQLALTGTKKGCDHGQCGACTVLANGRRINSCLSLAVVHEGEEITTVEGLAHGEELHPMQAAFLEHDGLQCGYCTPGQLCSSVALLSEYEQGAVSVVTADLRSTAKPELTPNEIRERMSGNICRCGAYPGIVEAVQSVHEQSRGKRS